MTSNSGFSWQRLTLQAEGLLSVSSNRISNAANLSALLYQEMKNISWVGFYFLDGDTLMLGPFQGKPACVSIALGKGVCGTAAASRKMIRVANVDTFEGHIACDHEARSELVAPLFKNGEVLGVIDIDSTSFNRFSLEDEKGLEKLVEVFLSSID